MRNKISWLGWSATVWVVMRVFLSMVSPAALDRTLQNILLLNSYIQLVRSPGHSFRHKLLPLLLIILNYLPPAPNDLSYAQKPILNDDPCMFRSSYWMFTIIFPMYRLVTSGVGTPSGMEVSSAGIWVNTMGRNRLKHRHELPRGCFITACNNWGLLLLTSLVKTVAEVQSTPCFKFV